MFRKSVDGSRSSGSAGGQSVICEPLEDRRLMSVTAQEFPIPTANAGAGGITRAKDGTYYFAETNNHALGASTATGSIVEYPLPTGAGNPQGVAQGSDGNIYVACTDGIRVFSPRYHRFKGAINNGVANGTLVSGTSIRDVISATDGTLWFTEINNSAVGHVFLDSQKVLTYATAAGGQPAIIYQDTVGSFWFTEQTGNKIGHVVLHSGNYKVVQFNSPTASGNPLGITQGLDGRIYYAESSGNKIGVVDTATGGIIEYSVPTANALPTDVAPGADGKVYFSENNSGMIGSINTLGQITEYNPLPTQNSLPSFFATGPTTGTFFLTEKSGNNIAEINYEAP